MGCCQLGHTTLCCILQVLANAHSHKFTVIALYRINWSSPLKYPMLLYFLTHPSPVLLNFCQLSYYLSSPIFQPLPELYTVGIVESVAFLSYLLLLFSNMNCLPCQHVFFLLSLSCIQLYDRLVYLCTFEKIREINVRFFFNTSLF